MMKTNKVELMLALRAKGFVELTTGVFEKYDAHGRVVSFVKWPGRNRAAVASQRQGSPMWERNDCLTYGQAMAWLEKLS